MQIHRIRGRDLRDALERARAQHGAEALVLSQETMSDGGVTVAVADPTRVAMARRVVTAREERRDPGLDDVARVLQRSGCSSALIEATLDGVRESGAHGPFALDAAASLLARGVAIAPSPRIHKRGAGSVVRPCVIAFVGATGVGKTTTLAKLASRLVRAGRRIGLVSMDTQRLGAVEQLRALAGTLGAGVEVARDAVELARVQARFATAECVLVDTTGRSPRDAEALNSLGGTLSAAGGSLETYLVVPASASRAALDEAQQGFSAARPTAWVVTKLDETRAPAPALESAAAAGAPLAFLCDGPEISAHFHRADSERVADLFLRGRLK